MGEAFTSCQCWISFGTNLFKLKAGNKNGQEKKITLHKQQDCGPYLKQAFPSESMAQAAINMWLDLFMHIHTATDWSTIGVYCLRLL